MNCKAKIFKISKLIFIILGIISFIGVVIIIVVFLYSITFGNRTIENKATKSDVKFVLNWCNLGSKREYQVLKSYISARSLTGDHLNAYAIEITDITIEELTKNNSKWYRADSLPTILNDVVNFIGDFQYEMPWFPIEHDIKTKDFYIYPCNLHYYNGNIRRPSAVQIILAKPIDKIIYYISFKT